MFSKWQSLVVQTSQCYFLQVPEICVQDLNIESFIPEFSKESVKSIDDKNDEESDLDENQIY